jgi:hypothetical protein
MAEAHRQKIKNQPDRNTLALLAEKTQSILGPFIRVDTLWALIVFSGIKARR